MSGLAKHEFFQWIGSLETTDLNDIDRKLLNLMVTNFDVLADLSTANGKRSIKINELIQKNHTRLSTEFPDIQSHQSDSLKKIEQLSNFEIGPFRGFESSELFEFGKKYTFIYGPNGSGKSSFCEGLEYALLGEIEEATLKRIKLEDYIKNAQKSESQPPVAYSTNKMGLKVEIPQNQAFYRFAFLEKNRIDGFARITATTANAQKDRIATLFGLDAFSEFVDGFTDNIEKYFILENAIESEFSKVISKNDTLKFSLGEIDKELGSNSEKLNGLVKEILPEGEHTVEDLRQYLNGSDGVSGFLQDITLQKTEQIPKDLSVEVLDLLPPILAKIRNNLELLDEKIMQLAALSSDLNFKDLYNAIISIGLTPDSDMLYCPACKTPIEQVVCNPFKNAKGELEKLESLAELQQSILSIIGTISDDVLSTKGTIKKINELCEACEFIGKPIPDLPVIKYTSIEGIEKWKPELKLELLKFKNINSEIKEIKSLLSSYNAGLSAKRELKNSADAEIKKYKGFNTLLIELMASEKHLNAQRKDVKIKIGTFETNNDLKLKEIENEKKIISINQQYVDAYKKLIESLKRTRDQLPSKLSLGLSDKTMEYYNIINAHDPEFEQIALLILPTTFGEKIEIRFKQETKIHNALYILSEGHIKVIGLSILLAKAVHENLGFLIFDDVVNAIDDDHRSGIADLLMCHQDLKERQHILTCHGETFIKTLEQKLGAVRSGKEVTRYRFAPVDLISERGIRLSIGDPKHYLLQAEAALNKDARKEAAFRCRQAVESLSECLWKKMGKERNINLSVKMRFPGCRPDLSSVVDSLIKELKKIDEEAIIFVHMKKLKELNCWALLNKGTHEQDDLPEFERKDVIDLLELVKRIEVQINSIKLETIIN